MGYTHYWTTKAALPPGIFKAIRADFEKILPALTSVLKLAGPLGHGDMVITDKEITFNGDENCGHKGPALSIPWPTPDAKGVAADGVDARAGQWFAGVTLNTRACGGDCSYETFAFRRDEGGFACCKTAFRPYDLAVTACLVIAKHHAGQLIEVSSDGEDENWSDAKTLCQNMLGYGQEFVIHEGQLEVA